MDADVLVRCTDCEYESVFESLRAARTALADHEQATSHDVDWQIGRLSAGVERAGDDAGVCGIEGCENPNSPLLRHSDTEGATE